MPRIVALVGTLMTLAPLACTTVVRPGLANAPALSGTPVDSRVHDAVANGRDSCERRLGSGPLRNEFPPCASDARAANPGMMNYPSSPKGPAMPWVQHYYYRRWPCSSWASQVGRMTLADSFASPPISWGLALRGATCRSLLE